MNAGSIAERRMTNVDPKAARARSGRVSLVAHHSSLVALLCVFAGCERNDMHNQPRHEPHEPSAFFDDGQSSRPLVTGTVARGQLVSDEMRYFGLPTEGQQPADTYPFEITRADLLRGQQRYNIYCSVCHGADGNGDGMIVQRGFTRPPSLHDQRLKDAPAGHFFNVITNGWGAMYSYNDRIFPEDRWRIIAYVKTLQLSQDEAVAAIGGIQPQQAARGGGGGGASSTPEAPGAEGGDDAIRRAVDAVRDPGTGDGGAAVEQPEQGRQPQDPQPQPPQEQPPTGAQPQPGGQQ